LYFYTPLIGISDDAKFILRDRNGKKLAAVKGKSKANGEIVVANGITEQIKFAGVIIDHRRVESIFYFVDNPSIRQEIWELPICSKDEIETRKDWVGGPCRIMQ
jgi:hypothetical protein